MCVFFSRRDQRPPPSRWQNCLKWSDLCDVDLFFCQSEYFLTQWIRMRVEREFIAPRELIREQPQVRHLWQSRGSLSSSDRQGFLVGFGGWKGPVHLTPPVCHVGLFIYFMALAAMWMLSNIHDQTGPLSSYNIWMGSLEAAAVVVKSSLRWNPLVTNQCWSHRQQTSSTLAQPLPSSRFHSKAFTQTKRMKTGKEFVCSSIGANHACRLLPFCREAQPGSTWEGLDGWFLLMCAHAHTLHCVLMLDFFRN